MENIQIQRKALFAESTHIKFKLFFDGSKQAVGVSVLVQNILPNNEAVTRLLCNKAKLCSDSINTAPRSEITACVISTRVKILICEQLAEFLSQFSGQVSFEILGDSLIVLSQIKKQAYQFKTFTAARIAEIKENTANIDLKWSHISGPNNISDVLTREYWNPPSFLPWIQPNIVISNDTLDMTNVPAGKLPDCDAKNVLYQNVRVQAEKVRVVWPVVIQ